MEGRGRGGRAIVRRTHRDLVEPEGAAWRGFLESGDEYSLSVGGGSEASGRGEKKKKKGGGDPGFRCEAEKAGGVQKERHGEFRADRWQGGSTIFLDEGKDSYDFEQGGKARGSVFESQGEETCRRYLNEGGKIMASSGLKG